jgi:hypothetical protein
MAQTAVYSRDGLCAAQRVDDSVYWGDGVRYYIVGDTVFDDAGAPKYTISGAWWYDVQGRGCYYQNDEIKDAATLAAEAEEAAAEAERERQYEAWRQSEIARRAKAEAERRRRQRKRGGWLHRMMGR